MKSQHTLPTTHAIRAMEVVAENAKHRRTLGEAVADLRLLIDAWHAMESGVPQSARYLRKQARMT